MWSPSQFQFLLSASLNPLAPPFLPDSGRQTNKTPNLNPLADSFSPSVPLPSPTHPSALRVLFLNIRSLRNKLNDILLLTQQLNAPDIVCVNETWLDATVSDQEIALTGYSVTRRDRSGRVGGGVCIYWKSCLPVKPRDDITTDGVESCWCEVACRPRSCLVGTIYRPPSEPVGYWDKLDEHLCAALRPQPNAIVCGDFNVNIDLSARDPQYHYLSDLLNSYALHHGVNKSTRFSSTGQDSTLDLILNNFDPSTTAKIIPVAFSDHAAVASDFHLIVPRGSDTKRLYRNYHRINHDHFRRDLTQKNLCSITGNPSAMWTEWSSRFIEVLDVHPHFKVITERRSLQCHGLTGNCCTYYTSGIGCTESGSLLRHRRLMLNLVQPDVRQLATTGPGNRNSTTPNFSNVLEMPERLGK